MERIERYRELNFYVSYLINLKYAKIAVVIN